MWENTIFIFFSDNGGPLNSIGNGQVRACSNLNITFARIVVQVTIWSVKMSHKMANGAPESEIDTVILCSQPPFGVSGSFGDAMAPAAN